MPRTLMIAFSTLGICLSCTQLANAQESFRQLMRNQNVLGFRMSFANEGRIIGGALEHVTSADTTLTAAAGIGLFDSTSDFRIFTCARACRSSRPQGETRNRTAWLLYLLSVWC